MAAKTMINCDNCGNEMDYGYQLTNLNEPERGVVSDRLERPAQFCCLLCLSMWADNAHKSADSMIKHARSLHPHGSFSDEQVAAMVVY